MKPILKLGGTVAMTVLLCGCQSIGLPGWSFKSHRATALPRQAVADYAAILDEGRAQLRAGSLSAAAASFRMASADPATAAEANNGLAVVYAKLGRNDLAERYFRTALTLEPESQRFASNLLRLQRQVFAREAATARMAAISQSSPEPRFVSATPDRSHIAAAGRIERMSRGVVHIQTTRELGGAPQIEVGYREVPAAAEPPPETSAPKTYEPRLTAALDKSKTYPVRFAFEP